nr:breast carcinoma-amplified sequence 4 isoform X3 [Oryctolagus cuniculus]
MPQPPPTEPLRCPPHSPLAHPEWARASPRARVLSPRSALRGRASCVDGRAPCPSACAPEASSRESAVFRRLGPPEALLEAAPSLQAGAKEVEDTVESMLLGLEEFCSLADMIRSDTSQILEENIPLLKAKVTEMRGIYAKVDQLEAFVKMVGHHVAFLEAHVLQAERDHGAFPQALRRWLGAAGLPSFRNASAPAPPAYELPTLYRTEDYFPVDTRRAQQPSP